MMKEKPFLILILAFLSLTSGQELPTTDEVGHGTARVESDTAATGALTAGEADYDPADYDHNYESATTDTRADSDTTDGASDMMTEADTQMPVAEKFIGFLRKKKTQQDYLREKMIGMIFTGEPTPLGYKPRSSAARRRYRTNPQAEGYYDTYGQKIIHINGGPALQDDAASRHLENYAIPPQKFRPEYRQTPRTERRPIPRRRKPSLRDRDHDRDASRGVHEGRDRSISRDIFSNTVGPDFGPVTFEEFGTNFETDPHSSNPHKRPSKPFDKPFKPSSHNSFSFSNSHFGSDSDVPKIHSFGHDTGSGGCHKYTEDICLDTDDYPHEQILSALAQDPVRSRILMAEVRDQSADNLVDGLSAAQEDSYDYNHYFGNRRQDTTSKHRDFAGDGGYLCPSEVKYARPKRARNSKGKWKFIVNMDKYSQTIRMEKCMKNGGVCSYVSHHYRATCNQIYNYQRLLSWEKDRGLHMDIFKVPSCCSCHIEGYAYVFPPLKTRHPGSGFAGSERIDQYVPAPDPEEGVNRDAPPYSPVNFPNFSSGSQDKPTMRSMSTRLRNRINRKRLPSSESNRGRTDILRRRINYDYHPIIDFFQNEARD